MLKQLGASDLTIEALSRGEPYDRFNDAERTALRFAERMTLDPQAVDDGLWKELSSHYDDGQIIELAVVVGIFNYFNRLSDALQVEITR